ncbi:MAE_28990/MAE_18760 family HEPN-like nuclease [Moraxella sp. FZLJ2107]|uniref:MAE_28990/MAE_18760 family HEPN-like nuclease n=1 Tax=unclassified Moraxella TaxID=2685852 RepID=UPI0020C84CB1|nr:MULTISPECIES: MAE_28990/MAE_18760 family HEPN-like nuclease [unclassified Moraxella]UTO05343.1 MAE_28990/MAE_18760 family HEPN-like nuclease [Moraxella sp. FZLJ2107]UTO22078.1 MAE_28990/MAE_18760 family HEPN-like nuclease [Moraxella sp. FZLJ2109]
MIQIQNRHLKAAYEEFQVRLHEVESYIDFVEKASKIDAPHLISNKADSCEEPYEISRELTKTLRASSYLMLYNLLESTMSNAIDSIHETIKSEQCDVMDLSKELHKIILKNIQKGLTEEKIAELSNNNLDHRERLFDLGYNKKKLFRGNIDYKIISDYGKKYGFKPHPIPQENQESLVWDANVIFKIKIERNKLAHGSVSFETCGAEMAVESLRNNLGAVVDKV